MNVIANIKSNPNLIFQGWESAGVFSELQQLYSEADGASPPPINGVHDQLSSQSSKLSYSTLGSIALYLFNRFSRVHEHFLGPDDCQLFSRRGERAAMPAVTACGS